MEKDRQKATECCPIPVKKEKEGEHESGSEDACRCKEVSKKSFSELLKLMLGDLAFWGKKK
ncbi:MAG: hypothetical protein HY754_01480 [Nitrospirae bacterium]|nr:hypothetical protein [Nitrospirota bacterium]